MPANLLLDAAVSLLPVILFLSGLLVFDSYKLVGWSETALCLAAGVLLCGVAFLANMRLLDVLSLGRADYSHFVAPFVEEACKGVAIAGLIWRNRIGFMIDAAIMGFAIGTGFGVVENLYYLSILSDPTLGTLLVRGVGTALMHGGTTALLAIASLALVDRRGAFSLLLVLPGYAVAVLLHGLFNALSSAPLAAALAMLLLLPAVLAFVFVKSEKKVHTWLLHDYEDNERLLADIRSGAFQNGEAGRFIASMSARLGPAVAADMFDYIRLHTELSLRADQVDLAREAGHPLAVTEADRESFARLHALERRIGRTAMLALWPHLHLTRKELWELNEFEQEVRGI